MAAPEPVAEADRQQHQSCEGERVGVRDPLQALDCRAEPLVDDGEGAGDDEIVERRHEHGQAGRDDGEPDRDTAGGGSRGHGATP